MPKKPARGAARTGPAPAVPDLPADEGDLTAVTTPPDDGAPHEGELFAGLDLSGVDARDTRFLGCVLRPTRADGFVLVGARLLDCRVQSLAATEAPWRASTWRDTVLADCRVGALDLSAARWDRVGVRGGRHDFVNLREAELVDVVFTGVDLRDVDLSGARLTRVRFEDCRIGHLDVTAATLDGVDLSTSEFDAVSGVGNLRGAVVSEVQLVRLAPLLAGHLGLRVR